MKCLTVTMLYRTFLVILILTCLSACGRENASVATSKPVPASSVDNPATASSDTASAIFAGGCFWCVEADFEKINGVIEVTSGYTGGSIPDPTYRNYARYGHVEVVEVTYDPSVITYDQLLDIFWQEIDPTDPGGQFVDRGPYYRSAIFYLDEHQKQLAEQSKLKLAESGRFDKPIVTEILPAQTFYDAEDYHQDFYKKNPSRYYQYRSHSGRDQFLDKVWGNDRITSTH